MVRTGEAFADASAEWLRWAEHLELAPAQIGLRVSHVGMLRVGARVTEHDGGGVGDSED